MPLPARKQKAPAALWAILGAALLARLVLAAVTEPYPYDYSTLWYWGDCLCSGGPAAFYTPGGGGYPPLYILVLGLLSRVRMALGIAFNGPAGRALFALVPAVCDGGIAALVWHAARQSGENAAGALRIAAFTALCPSLVFDTAVWKQVDGAFLLPLLFCMWWLEQKRYLPAALAYGVALAVKPQALLAGPVLAAAFLAAVADAVPQGKAAVKRAVGRIFGGAALALVPALLCGLPFFGLAGLVPGLWDQYFSLSTFFDYATINGYNWLALLGGNWQSADALAGGLVSWRVLGMAGIVLATLALAVLAVRGWRAGRFSPLMLSAFYLTAVYTFAHAMHERYVIFGTMAALLAAAYWRDRQVYAAGYGLSLVGLINQATVYTLTGTEDEWMTSATSTLVVRLTGLAETGCFLLLAWGVWRFVEQGPAPVPAAPAARPLRTGAAAAGAPLPRWQRREVLALAGLTAATAVLSFVYLGDTKAPQNGADANGGVYTATAELLPHGSPLAALWVYPGISRSNNGLLTVTDASGALAAQMELGHTTPFTWARLDLSAAGPGPYTVTVENGQVMELCFRDAAGETYPLSNTAYADPLFDEQALVPDTISQLNSFYFDEIYHARTGYELLHALPVYETTHPPLGKVFIMLGIAVFGMTGFGWRFAGTLFGVLMVPLAWAFARRLTRKPWAGALAGALLALDLFRFAQSRMATIDTCAAFFILLGAHCMLWYCQSVLQKGVLGSFVPMALGGAAFGLGCACKWTGLYAGMGLAALYLGVLWARWRQKPPDFWREFCAAALGGVGFYVLLPLGIYTASYLPYTWRDPGFGLDDVWRAQLTMFSYHANLSSTHPFESRWYTWLLGLRPVWYYGNTNLPAGTRASIAGLAGPVIWLAGLACILLLLWRQISGCGTRAGAAVLILYAAQLLPWMLVQRSTFLYHYFPSVLFCLAAIALVLARAKDARAARCIGVGLCVASLVVFAVYYPAVSGLPVPDAWLKALRVLPSFGF